MDLEEKMRHHLLENMEHEAARAFAKDAYRQFREQFARAEVLDAQVRALADIAIRHQREHDARSFSGVCDCTACMATQKVLKVAGIPKCERCGIARADGTHKGTKMCVDCMRDAEECERGGAD